MAYNSHYPYRNLVEEACQIYEMDDALVRAVIEVESDYNRFAISNAGARGLMQLMPETMHLLGVNNPWDARQNVQGGTRYLKKMLNRFSGDINLALAAYNAGASAVLKYGRVPPYPQTQRYVKKVMLLYLSYSGTTYR
jgi:soluble lytic murein transglycosylase-like protein